MHNIALGTFKEELGLTALCCEMYCRSIMLIELQADDALYCGTQPVITFRSTPCLLQRLKRSALDCPQFGSFGYFWFVGRTK